MIVKILIGLYYRARLIFEECYQNVRYSVRAIRYYLWSCLLSRNDKRNRSAIATAMRHAFRGNGVATRVTVTLYHGPGYSELEDKKICWEAPYAVTIWKSNTEPLCGMAIDFRPGALCIRQLQGIAGVPLAEIMPDWQDRFVNGCIFLAACSGIRYVRLYRADQSLFYEHPEFGIPYGEEYLERKKQNKMRLRRRYDGTARRHKFKMKKRWGEWTNPHYARPG